MFFILLLTLSAPALLFLLAHRKTLRLAQQAEIAVPQAGHIMPVAEGAIHYVELGPPDAQPVVLIHGLSGQLQHFTYAMAQDLAQDFRVIIPDRPGCGYSRRDDESLADPTLQAQMLWHFLDAIVVETPVVIGHSLGGAVALAMALDRPGHIRSLGLIAPLTHPVQKNPDSFRGLRIRSRRLRAFLANSIAIPLAERTAETVLTQVFAPESYPESFLTDAGAALGLRPQAFVAASADLVAAEAALPDQSAAYAHADFPPGAVLFGAQDAILDPTSQGQAMQAHGFSFQVLPDRGHMLPITAPQACNQFIREVAALS